MAQVVYQFRAVGADAVAASFKSIGDAAESSARRAQRAQVQQARGAQPGGSTSKAADKQLAAVRKEAQAWEREEKSKTKATEREANARANAETKAAARAQAHVKAIRDRYMAQQQRDGEKADRAAQRRAEKTAAIEQRGREKASKARWGGLGDDARGLGKGIALSAGAATVGVLGVATRDSMALQEKASRIAINARGHGEEFQDPTALRKSFEATAMTTPGIKAIDVADAVAKYVSLTGDTKTALSSQGTFATAASASGAEIGDIAEAAASLTKQFDITGIEEMRDALAALTGQGKAGAFELKDAAEQFQELAAAGAAFGLDKGAVGVKKLGGLAQIARSGTGSASEATTAVRAVFAAFTGKQGALKKQGVDVFKDGKRRDIEDLLVDTISKTGGTDIAKKSAGLDQIFGDRGFKAIAPLLSTYNTAYAGATGTKDERQQVAADALRAAIQKATNTTFSWADVVTDAAQAQTTSSATVTQAWERVTAMAGEELAPAFTKLIGELTSSGALDKAIGGLAVFASALADVATAMGIMFPKGAQSTEEKRAAAEKVLADFDAKNGDVDAKRSELDLLPDSEDRDAKVVEADRLVRERTALMDNVSAVQERKDEVAKLSPEEFRKQYADLGTRDGMTDQIEASRLSTLYAQNERPTEWLPNMWEENNAQKDLRRSYEERLGEEQVQGQAAPPPPGGEEAAAAMKDMAVSAQQAADALKNVKPAPSIFGPGGP